jgi:hypothetical protein
MKSETYKKESGNALIVILMTVVIISIALTSYLSLVSNQNKAVARSTAWNQAIPVLESGIEEALTQLHYCYTNNLWTNNWTLGSDGLYHKNRTNSDGSYYSVSILPTNPPIIYSTGYVLVPMYATSASASPSSKSYVMRRVRVNTIAPEAGGIYAKGAITMGGNGFVNSFDSSNPTYSTGGQYVASKSTANATVLTDSSTPGAISAKDIYGSVVTGPGGTVTGGPVGDSNYIATVGSGIETNHIANDANVQFNDNSAPFPFASGITPAYGNFSYNGTNYNCVLGTGNYSVTSVSLSGSQSIAITGTPTVVYVSGSLSITGGDIYVAPGASLQLYLGGTANFSGQGAVNDGGVATNLYIYGLPTCTSMYFAGNSEFVGIVNAPEAAFTYAGNSDYCGSITAGSVKITGNGNFHCDTSISLSGVTVASWNEF